MINRFVKQQCLLIRVSRCAVILLLLFLAVPCLQAEEWLKMTAFGSFIPETSVNTTDAGFSSTAFKVSVSVPIVQVQYGLSRYSWDQPDTLVLGNGKNAPWKQLHRLSVQTMYAGKMTPKWAYLLYGKGSAAFEERLNKSFLDGTLVSGMRYTLSDQWYLMFGGGVKSDDFRTIPFPAGGFQWNGTSGFSLSVIFPLESKISYESANRKLSTSVDFRFSFPPSAKIVYRVSPAFDVETSYSPSGSLHRLSSSSLAGLANGKTYIKATSHVVGLEFRFFPIKQLSCNLGLDYHFLRELSLLDEEEKSIKTFTSDDAFGGTFSFTYRL